MTINWYGQTCFRIAFQRGKNETTNIIINPFEKEAGFRSPKLEADIFILGNKSDGKMPDNGFLVNGPGEYDVKEAFITGLDASSKGVENYIYVIEAEELRICHLGYLNKEEFGSDQLEEIGDIDILMIPVGGTTSIDAKTAVKLMGQIEPRITIPMLYKVPKIQAKLDGLDKFLGSLGIKSLQSLPKLSVKKKDIAKDEAKIVILE